MSRIVFLVIFLAFESYGSEHDRNDLRELSEISFSEAVVYEFNSSYGEKIESIPSAERTSMKIALDKKGLGRLKGILVDAQIFTKKKSWSACYHPHHAIVLKDSEGDVTSVHVCLSCNNFVVSNGPTQALENPKELIEFLKDYNFPLKGVQAIQVEI